MIVTEELFSGSGRPEFGLAPLLSHDEMLLHDLRLSLLIYKQKF